MLHKIFSGLKDLLQVLPTTPESEWMEFQSLDPLRPTIVLVSGFGATARNLSVIRKRFLKDGYNVFVLALDWHELSDSVKGFYRMAEKLSTLILQLRKQSGMRDAGIYIVAHSAGGLVARYYVQQLGGSHYTQGMVTLATPHQGTWYAALGFFTLLILKGRCLFQMLPAAPFIKKLNRAVFPDHFPFVSVYSPDDMLCHERATRLPLMLSKHEEVETIRVPRLTHGDFLVSKRCYESVRKILARFSGKPLPESVSATA